MDNAKIDEHGNMIITVGGVIETDNHVFTISGVTAIPGINVNLPSTAGANLPAGGMDSYNLSYPPDIDFFKEPILDGKTPEEFIEYLAKATPEIRKRLWDEIKRMVEWDLKHSMEEEVAEIDFMKELIEI